jgi:hypothetical protein
MTLVLTPQHTKRQATVQQPKGPKARLISASKPDINLRKVSRDYRVPARLLPVVAAAVGIGWLASAYPPAWPEAGADWSAWLDPAGFALFALATLALLGWFTARTIKAWKASAPGSPEGAVREFYRVATAAKPRARRLASLLCRVEHEPPATRPVLNWMTASAFPRLDSARAVAKYWRALLRGNPLMTRAAMPQRVDVEFPVANVALARVKLATYATRRPRAALALLAGVMIALAPLIAGPDRIAGMGLPFWGLLAASCALGAGARWLMRRLSRAVIQRREVTVHKILVHNANNWRLLSGEWESADEADASWLLKI